MQVHMQNAARGTCRGRTLLYRPQLPVRSQNNTLSLAQNGANAGSGQTSSREPCDGLGASLPAMRNEIDKSDLHGHRESGQTDHETKNYALSERLTAARSYHKE